MGKERWSDEGPALVRECCRVACGDDLSILSWAVQCGFANDPLLREASSVLRSQSAQTLRDDEDLIAAIHFLVQWLSLIEADAGLVQLLHDLSNRHFEVSFSRIYCSHNIALLARSLTSVVTVALTEKQRVEMLTFPDTMWLPGEAWKPLIEAASLLNLETTANKLLAVPELLQYCVWRSDRVDVVAARMAGRAKKLLGGPFWKALLPSLVNDRVLALVRPLFYDESSFDGQVWKDWHLSPPAGSVPAARLSDLLLASVQALLVAPPPQMNGMLVNLIGLCHLELDCKPDLIQRFDAHRACAMVTLTDSELCGALSTVASATSDKDVLPQLFSEFRMGYLMACSGSENSMAAEQIDARWMVWMGHTLATQLVARKLRLMPNLATPQALFSQLARFLSVIAAGERPASSRVCQMILCFTVQRLECAMQAAMASDDKFYVANQRVCEDFFARIRGVLIGAFSHLGAWSEVAQQWLLILPEMRSVARADATKVSDLVGCLCSSLSLVGEHGLAFVADALVVFGKSVEVEFGVKLPFLAALSLMAHRRLEEAARALRVCLESAAPESFVANFLICQINICYLLLGSVDQASEWLASGQATPKTLAPDAAKKMRVVALQRFATSTSLGVKEFVPMPSDGPAVAMACWAVENVSISDASALLLRQVVCADMNPFNLSICSLMYASRFGISWMDKHSEAMVPLWGLMRRVGKPVIGKSASLDYLSGGNVNAAIEVAGPVANAKLFHLQLRVQRSLSVDVPSTMRQSLHEDSDRAALLLRALQKNLVVGANKLDREQLVSCVTDSRVLGLYLARQLASPIDLRPADKESLSKWLLQDARITHKQALNVLTRLTTTVGLTFDDGPSLVVGQIPFGEWGLVSQSDGTLLSRLEAILTGIREHLVCKPAKTCFESLAKTLASDAKVDVEVALGLIQALESSGCGALFLECVRPVFQHCSWVEVVPQLLARLGDGRIGKCVMNLLEALASGSVANAQALFWPAKTAKDGASSKAEQREAASVLCERIQQMHPQVCAGCTVLYEGFRMLGSLWEEQWQRLVKGLVSALRRANNGAAVKSLQDQVCLLYASTVGRQNLTGLSPHQVAFARSMHGPLQHFVAMIRANSNILEAAQELLQELTRMCDTNTLIPLSEISPTLCQLSSTHQILIPGEYGSGSTLFSFGAKVDVLRTKTRPKRVVAIASDGSTRLLLVKHGEDLRLDERLMQVFKAAKQWHYAVVPVGPFCGVIHIVEGLVSLFDLFRKQHKQDEYYSKLQARLAASKRHGKWLGEVQNARDIEHHRAEWGGEKAILLDIYRELCKSNPSDLVQRELVRQALTAGDWIRRVDNFSDSTARISMLGYVIGLGDRHLDNILFDLQTGRVLHIDLSVCFESGKLLKVPELVPFRLTQNIRGGMRYGAVEGAFADLCTVHLEQLREKSSEILMLLQAFVLDEIQGINNKKRGRREYSIKRVEQKLMGCDFGKVDLTAREQAQLSIDAAISAENLSLMYSGWGSWW